MSGHSPLWPHANHMFCCGGTLPIFLYPPSHHRCSLDTTCPFQIMPWGRPRRGGRWAGLTHAGPYSRRAPRTSSATPAAFPAVSTGGDTHTTSESRSASHRVADLGLNDFVDLIRAVVREELEGLLPAVSSRRFQIILRNLLEGRFCCTQGILVLNVSDDVRWTYIEEHRPMATTSDGKLYTSTMWCKKIARNLNIFTTTVSFQAGGKCRC